MLLVSDVIIAMCSKYWLEEQRKLLCALSDPVIFVDINAVDEYLLRFDQSVE